MFYRLWRDGFHKNSKNIRGFFTLQNVCCPPLIYPNVWYGSQLITRTSSINEYLWSNVRLDRVNDRVRNDSKPS